MTPLTNLNSRNLLIAIHDAVATTLAVLASLRFEGDLLADRLPLLPLILPFFIVLSVITNYACAKLATGSCNQTILRPPGWTTAVHPVLSIGSHGRGQFSFKV